MEPADRKLLVLKGTQRVCKTMVVNLFAADFKQYIYLNLLSKLFRSKRVSRIIKMLNIFLKDYY
jgi:hypothetical protein